MLSQLGKLVVAAQAESCGTLAKQATHHSL